MVVLCATFQVLFQNQTTEKTKEESVPPGPEITAVLPTSAPPAWHENGKKQGEKSSEAAAYQHVEVGQSKHTNSQGWNITSVFVLPYYSNALFIALK